MSQSAAGKMPATLIPGDGIGPEIVASVVEVLDALGSPFEWDEQPAGMAASRRSATRCPTSRSTASGATSWR